MDLQPIYPRDLETIVQTMLRCPELPSIFVSGPPGIGKTKVIEGIGAKEKIKVVIVHLASRDVPDTRGVLIPDMQRGMAVWLRPEELPREERDGKKGILFLDELTSALPSLQITGHSLLQDRKIDDFRIPPGWIILGAGNGELDKTVYYKMPAPVNNRVTHYVLQPNLNDWIEWAARNDIDERIIAYHVWKKGKNLMQFDPEKYKANIPFPSPRSWENTSKWLQSDLPENLMEKTVLGTIGPGDGLEFWTFCRVRENLPDIQAMIEGKIPIQLVEDRPDLSYLIVTTLVRSAETEVHLNRMIDWCRRNRNEYSGTMLTLIKNNKKMVEFLRRRVQGGDKEIKELWETLRKALR